MENTAIALFGEAEKGEFRQGYFCKELSELMDLFGNPPSDSQGLFYATQALLYHYSLIYFRVEQEGFSKEDYLTGIKILSVSPLIKNISAICTPGVGDHTIIDAIMPLCFIHHQIYITNERDFMDFVTN